MTTLATFAAAWAALILVLALALGWLLRRGTLAVEARRRRWPHVAVVLAAWAATASAQVQVEHVLVKQTPDDTTATRAPYTPEFAPCCTAYSASTVQLYHPLSPAVFVGFHVILRATTERDAVRLRLIDHGTTPPTVHDLDPLAPSPVGAPVPRGVWLNDVTIDGMNGLAWFNSRTAQVHYVLETRGAPLIFGAKLEVKQ